MYQYIRKLTPICSSFILALSTMSAALADDTDLFVASSAVDADVKPNLLLIIDSSTSMNTVDVRERVLQCTNFSGINEIIPFDPNVTYPGPFENNRIYFYTAGFNLVRGFLPRGSFPTSDNHCAAIEQPLASVGEAFSENFINYDFGQWFPLSDGNLFGREVECSSDAGVHGETENDGRPFARSGVNNPRWTSSESSRYRANFSNARSVFSGNRMNYDAILLTNGGFGTPPGTRSCVGIDISRTRLEVVQDVANDLIDSVTGINIGIMTFNGNNGGFVRSDLLDVDDTNASGTSHKDELQSVIDGIIGSGNTPLGETLYEATRFFRGDTPFYGNSSTGSQSVASSLTANGSRYDSPITDECQTTNHIMLLSDGQPTRDSADNDAIENYLRTNHREHGNAVTQITNDDGSTTPVAFDCPADASNRFGNDRGGSCLVDVARMLSNSDHSSLEGNQTARVYTIGLAESIPILEDAAQEGKGLFFQANDAAQLTDALRDIVGAAKSESTTFLSPAVSVSAFNRLQHNDELYFALFQPNVNARWNGNLKRYRIRPDGVIVDSNSRPAVDDEGQFDGDAQSFWSEQIDGDRTTSGGAVGVQNFVREPRNAYTYTGAEPPADPENPVDLTLPAHDISTGNDAITLELLDAQDEDERLRYINWGNGLLSAESPHNFISDPLHSRPVVVVYGIEESTDEQGNPISVEDTTVYFGTNEGFLHAIDGNTGEEQFAFIPQQLLSNLGEYADNTAGEKLYGLDGEITVIRNDFNNNGLILGENGEPEVDEDGNKDSVYLYIGMRRGGRDYFAFDVTDRDKPKYMWRIQGGVGEFEELAQSWGRPFAAKINVVSSDNTEGTPTDVLIFGGGYDTDQDNADVQTPDSEGRSIFMVNAKTGDLIWSAGPNDSDDLQDTDLQYSIPAGVNAADVDGDGFVDLVIAANMGGEVWRFDFADEFTSASTFATGGRIFATRSDGTSATNRRFFNRPDLAFFAPRGEAPYFTVALGSGARPDPLDQITVNRFYAFREFSPFEAPTVEVSSGQNEVRYTTLFEDQLFDATGNEIQVGDEQAQERAEADLESRDGWFITLDGGGDSGEKVLSQSVIFNGVVFFSTYVPTFDRTNTSRCETNLGLAFQYAVNLFDGTAAFDQDNDGTIDTEDRRGELKRTGIAPSASIILVGDGSNDAPTPFVTFGTEVIRDLDSSSLLQQEYWREDR